MESIRPSRYFKTLTMKEKAALYASLIREPGWELLKQTFRPDLRTRITDSDAKESFLYEAIRAQVIQEIFSTPAHVIHQVDREYFDRHAQALTEPMSPIDADTSISDNGDALEEDA
jgi:hypothetical protein